MPLARTCRFFEVQCVDLLPVGGYTDQPVPLVLQKDQTGIRQGSDMSLGLQCRDSMSWKTDSLFFQGKKLGTAMQHNTRQSDTAHR